MNRSHEPVIWLLFGAGGFVVALCLPVYVLATGIAIPLGLMPVEVISYDNVGLLFQSPFSRLLLVCVISLSLWHAVHRIYLVLHDFGISHILWRWLLYGCASLSTVLSVLFVQAF